MATAVKMADEGPWALPVGWRWARISSVCSEPTRGAPAARFKNTFRYTDVGGVGENATARIVKTDEAPSRARQFVEPGDTLISCVRVNLRRTVLVGEDETDVASTAFSVLRPNRSDIEPRYLHHWVCADHFVNLLLPLQRGGTPPAVLDRDVRAQLVPIPPPDVQRRIVARIDELFAELDDGEEELARARQDLERYRKSLLKAAVTGELTADWRQQDQPTGRAADLLAAIQAERLSNPSSARRAKGGAEDLKDQPRSLPESWTMARFDDLCDTISDGGRKIKERDYLEAGAFPIVDQGAKPIAGFTDDQSLVKRFDSPVILFGDHTRRFKFVDFPFCVGADGVKIIKPSPLMSSRFIWYSLLSSDFEDRGYSRHYQFVRRLLLPVPPLSEQIEICRVLQYHLNEEVTLMAETEEAINLSSTLRQSILAAAFRGELVS